MSCQTEDRREAYKNKSKSTDFRKKRQEENVQLRKFNRDAQLLKRRNINLEELHTSPLKEQNEACTAMSLDEVVHGIFHATDVQQQYICTQNARKILSRQRSPPIDKMIDAGIVPRLVNFLSFNHKDLQFEAAWALTNIASGNSKQTTAVVHADAVPPLINLLSNENSNVVEQAVWALGNIAGDGPSMRDYVLDKNIIKPLIALVTEEAPATFLQNVTWTISNLCRNKNPHTALPYVVQLLPTIVKLVQSNDRQVQTDACWALSYITDGPNERIDLVIKTGIVEPLCRFLSTGSEVTLITPILRTLGNIVTGTDQQTQLVIDLGALTAFPWLLVHEKPTIQKEAVWMLSNITAGTQIQIQAVVDANLMPRVIELLVKGDYKTQKEACWTITNYTSGASIDQIKHLIQHNAVTGLCRMLSAKESKIIQVCLDGISNLLVTADKLGCKDEMCLHIEENQGLDLIENLQNHDNDMVYSMALHIIDRFFNDEEEQEQEELAPQETATGYDFSVPATNMQSATAFQL